MTRTERGFLLAGVLLGAIAAVWMDRWSDPDTRTLAAVDEFDGGGSHAVECHSRRGGSRWSSAGGYRLEGAYGDADEQWLTGVVGLVRGANGRVYILDLEAPVVVSLSPDLADPRFIGREGPGPGELTPVPSFMLRGRDRNWLSASGDSLFVFDGRAISVFDLEGEFRNELTAFRPPGNFLTVHSIAYSAALSDLLYAVDSGVGPVSDPSARHFATVRVTPEGEERLFTLSLPPLPRNSGGTFTGPNQALPKWEMHQGCSLVSDGAGPWIVRHQLESGTVDTLALPDVEAVPAEVTSRARRSMEELGRRDDLPEPTARARWAEMTMDPDGHLWILPETEQRGDPPFEVVLLDVEDGSVEVRDVPAFPRAFGAAGDFYAVRRDPDLEVSIVERYQMTSTP